MIPIIATLNGTTRGQETFDLCQTTQSPATPHAKHCSGTVNALQNLSPEKEGAGSPREAPTELKQILVPIDFSPASQRGLAFAAGIAARFRSQIHLLYVVEPPSLPEWGYAHVAIEEAKLRHAAENRLAQFPAECGADSALVRSAQVRNGAAEFEIYKTAREQSADLIVIASHGLGGLKHKFIGSTSEAVVRHAPCPVLTVREHTFATEEGQRPCFAPRRILLTTDFSEASKKAFPYAMALARKFEASLILVHVVPSHLPAELSHMGMVLEEKEMLSKAQEHLPGFQQAELDPHLHVETAVLHGGPAHEICTSAAMQGADLIVISTHGHTGLKRFALGSVTENVVRHAPCPVLVVREREHEFLKS
jgi:nucleotide-binding universal stress UspA family protein